VLAEQESFEPKTAFRRLDIDRKGRISPSDIKRFLQDNKIPIQDDIEAALVLRHYDLDNDLHLNYEEFLSLVLPKNDAFLRAAC
jgi:Ca2+-binding EF-hand superfamily protein